MAPLSRNPDELARQVDATIRVREDHELARLRGQLGSVWYEFFLLAGIFCFSIGVAVTILWAIPSENETLYRFMVFWLLGFQLFVVLALEYCVRRIRALRRTVEILLTRQRRLEESPTGGPEPATAAASSDNPA